MRPIFCYPFMILLIALPLRAEKPRILYKDDFSSVAGYEVTNAPSNSPTTSKTRSVFAFASESIAGGDLTISALEDDKSAGPDGKAGVLALSISKIPAASDYCGFIYLGRKDDQMKLPQLRSRAGEAQLERVQVSFRYKAAHENEADVGSRWNFRFEPDVDDAYQYRIDFGRLVATSKWKTFESTLNRGLNKSEFVSAIDRATANGFKLVFGQEGPITNYDAGDTLVIDDIAIAIID